MCEFHANGKMVKGSNSSYIVLIPKKDGACHLDNYLDNCKNNGEAHEECNGEAYRVDEAKMKAEQHGFVDWELLKVGGASSEESSALFPQDSWNFKRIEEEIKGRF